MRGRGRRLLPLLALPLLTMLGGCKLRGAASGGYVAEQQRNLVLAATGLMLLIIIPVIAFTLIFAWRYRATNEDAVYDPEWHHSTQLEVLIWTAPLMIIIALGALTWIGTHTLDPFRPLSKIDAKRDVPAGTQPLEIEALAMDWKWLFPLPAIRDRHGQRSRGAGGPADPVQDHRHRREEHVYVPTLAGMVYAMPGMQTQLHAVINRDEGAYEGAARHITAAPVLQHVLQVSRPDQRGLRPVDRPDKAKGGELTRRPT